MLGAEIQAPEFTATGTVSTNTIFEPDAYVIGEGTQFKKELLQPGQRISIDGTEAVVALVNSDSKLTLMKNWGGGTVKGGTMQVIGPLPPGITPTKRPGASGGSFMSGAAGAPLYKNPWVILAAVAVIGAGGYWYWRRRHPRRNPPRRRRFRRA